MAVPPGFVGNPGGKGGPNIQPYFGGGGGGAYGGGKGGYQLGGAFPFKKRPLQPEAQPSSPAPPPAGAAYFPLGGGGPGNQHPLYINPYAGIPGFEDYKHDILRIRGDQIGKPGIQNYPAARGFPDRARVTQISEAMKRLGAMPPPAVRGMGQGAGLGNPDDEIRKLLRQRLYGEGVKGVV